MRKLLFLAVVTFAFATAYIAAPFVTAWNIREAVKDGDSTYLAGKIDWDRVKETLKVSLASATLDLPEAGASATGGAVAGDSTAGPSTTAKPSLWQRLKTYVGRGAVNHMVETYANAEGLPKLFAYRQTYRGAVGHTDEPKTIANLPARIQQAWSRVRRASFVSPTRFEMEMADKSDPGRSFAGVLELEGLEWKLVSLHINQQKQPNSLTGALVGSDTLGSDSGGSDSGGSDTDAAPRGMIQRLRAAAIPRMASREPTGDPQER